MIRSNGRVFGITKSLSLSNFFFFFAYMVVLDGCSGTSSKRLGLGIGFGKEEGGGREERPNWRSFSPDLIVFLRGEGGLQEKEENKILLKNLSVFFFLSSASVVLQKSLL